MINDVGKGGGLEFKYFQGELLIAVNCGHGDLFLGMQAYALEIELNRGPYFTPNLLQPH